MFLPPILIFIVNDIYRPITKNINSDKKELNIARLASLLVKIIAVLLVPFFNNFDSIYEAHGWFHSTFTPPLVVGIFLGIFWKKFTSSAIIATFLVGGFLMILGQFYPELIKPFSHGIELRPGKGYSYIGALYNIFVCATVGIVVSFFTKPPDLKRIKGLTIFDVKDLKQIFKGSEINEIKGEKISVEWKRSNQPNEFISFSKNDMKRMKAKKGDLVYLSDSRKWLGGLKSIHSSFDKSHNEDGIVYLSSSLIEKGLFIDNKILTAEKEM